MKKQGEKEKQRKETGRKDTKKKSKAERTKKRKSENGRRLLWFSLALTSPPKQVKYDRKHSGKRGKKEET